MVEVSSPGCKRLLSVCRGVSKAKLMAPRLDEDALDSIRACLARILCATGDQPVASITVDMGHLWSRHQRQLRQLFPQHLVLVTPLIQLPLIRTCLSTKGKTLLVTWDEALSGYQTWLEDAGVRDDGVNVLSLDPSEERGSCCLSGRMASWGQQALLGELTTLVQSRILELRLQDSRSKQAKGISESTAVPAMPEVWSSV